MNFHENVVILYVVYTMLLSTAEEKPPGGSFCKLLSIDESITAIGSLSRITEW